MLKSSLLTELFGMAGSHGLPAELCLRQGDLSAFRLYTYVRHLLKGASRVSVRAELKRQRGSFFYEGTLGTMENEIHPFRGKGR
jgi:hypothetical protein